MNSNLISSMLRKSSLSHRFTIITVLFLSVLLSLLAYTILTLQKNKSNAFLVDMAGRQRMLIQKHSNEVFLTSQGMPVDYTSTRTLIHSTLDALLEGGLVILDPETGQRQTVPVVPTKEVWSTLREQQNYFNQLIALADNFLMLTPDHPDFRQMLQSLRVQTSILIGIADDAVKQLDAYSESNIATMIKWEIFIALVVGILGIFVTGQGIRDGRRLENEVSERKRAEAALRNSEMFLNSIVENIPDMIFVKTAKDLRLVRLNKAGEELLECSREDILGKTDHDLFPKEQADFFTAKDREVLVGKKLVDIAEEPVQTRGGGLRFLHTKKIPLLDEQGLPEHLLGISEDITERKQTAARLHESEMKRNEALRQSDELKSALLASVSHELRTPLTAMKASVSNITANALNGMTTIQQELLKGIDQEINYMSRLVDNLLDMSQVEAGTLVPHQEWHPLEDLVEGALRRTEQALTQRKIEIHIPENTPPVYVDAEKIQQVLCNLLDNAGKYSWPDSTIQILVRVATHEITVQVSSEGEPLQAQDLERIFDRFYRRPIRRNQPIRGTGLGLAICKGIIETHGGRIWAESTNSKVSIIFTLPMTQSMSTFSLEGLQKG